MHTSDWRGRGRGNGEGGTTTSGRTTSCKRTYLRTTYCTTKRLAVHVRLSDGPREGPAPSLRFPEAFWGPTQQATTEHRGISLTAIMFQRWRLFIG